MSLISHSQFKRDFETLGKLGQGNCAIVYKIRHKITKELFALKVSQYNRFSDYGQIVSEIEVIMKLDDSAIPKIYYYYFQDHSDSQDPKKRLFTSTGIIMELCGHTLEQEIKNIGEKKMNPYGQERVWNFIKEMVRFFAKMQDQGYSHRDIKPGNIMVKDSDGKKMYKIIDFGYALKNTPYACETITGTQDYASPKIEQKFLEPKIIIEGGLNVKDDVFSLGKTILELIRCKHTKNQRLNPQYLNEKIRKFDSNICDLLLRMLHQDESLRWDFRQLKNEIENIQKLQGTTVIALDDSLQEETHQIRQSLYSQSEERFQSSQFDSISMNLKDPKTIETQTESTQAQFPGEIQGHFSKYPIRSPQITQYVENRQKFDAIIAEDMVLSKCSFDNEIHSIFTFEEFVVFGMRNEIGIIPLKKKNDAIYKLKPDQFDQTPRQAVFTNIMIIGSRLVFVGTIDCLFYCDVNYFIEYINFMLENHEELAKSQQINQVMRTKDQEYRQPKLFSCKVEFFSFLWAINNAKISCVDVPKQSFLGLEYPIIEAHYDGSIGIVGQKIFHEKDQAIVSLKAFDSRKVLFCTNNGWLKLIELKQNALRENVESIIYSFKAESIIKHFRILNEVPHKKNPEKWQDKIFVQLFLENGDKVYLDHELESLATVSIKNKNKINKIIESEWDWAFKNEEVHFKEKMMAQRKIPDTFLNNQRKEIYSITAKGQILGKDGLKVILDLKMPEPNVFDVSQDTIVAADTNGYVKLMYREAVFDNELRPIVRVKRTHIPPMIQKAAIHFSKAPINIENDIKVDSQNSDCQKTRNYKQFTEEQGGKIDLSFVGRGRLSNRVNSNKNAEKFD